MGYFKPSNIVFNLHPYFKVRVPSCSGEPEVSVTALPSDEWSTTLHMQPRPGPGAVSASVNVYAASVGGDVSGTITAAPLTEYEEILGTLVLNKHNKQRFNVRVGVQERTFRMPTGNELPGGKESTFFYIEVGGFGAPDSIHLGEGLFR